MKPVVFIGNALQELRAFPVTARREAGYQLDRVQNGFEPSDWKVLAGLGSAVREIRISDANGAFRIVHVARFAEALHVLHCFQKKSQKTGRLNLKLAAKRYGELMRDRKT
jgi:phage-related protein